ncbi:ClpP family protease [Nakamurella aerolata]|uniref:ATP-dependent Clp protease proteolytic subunit n=1 Tax=Nakamurella aerolata TaxID=1656892 RepID=A0A849AB86_9ACTN|nr:ATP-dependent Clp protease proteolytic subunit [Nakamurella aerolata]NNG35740.1 ATP-dependent Clp protease proteolytic subunit [Nakamurella aerolata]
MAHFTIPQIVERTATGERFSDVYSRLLSDRVIYLGTEIDDDVANVIVAQLILLEYSSPDQQIELFINSPGGSMSAGMAVYDTMQFISPPVATTCIGQASSAAAVLMAGGAKGRRSMLPHTRMVLHQPWISGGRASISDLLLQSDELVRTRAQMNEVLARHTGRAAGQILADTARDKVFTADQAVEYGLADQIVESRKAGERADPAAG